MITYLTLQGRLTINNPQDLSGDVALLVDPLVSTEELPSVIPQIYELFKEFSAYKNFRIVFCVVAQDFILRNDCNITCDRVAVGR